MMFHVKQRDAILFLFHVEHFFVSESKCEWLFFWSKRRKSFCPRRSFKGVTDESLRDAKG